ncbi:unnamed protein product [Litomosoides sigmodontis]|uniref:C2H2-type domain-containing protein n=1 Tax=Litomosoides sigmodontis TaxID=42156 RepID=A0A3P6TY03_LITSI|nr:unnamed protein product [Litomosoides sigmodontis]
MLNSLCEEESKLPVHLFQHAPVNLPNVMDPLQQRFLAQFLRQAERETLELKACRQTTMEHQLQQQVPSAGAIASNFWFASFATQRSGTTYSPDFMQNFNATPAILNSVMNTNYLSAIAPSAMSLLSSAPSIEEAAHFDEVASSLVADELHKVADSTAQTWQNLIQHHEMQSSRLTTQHGLHQQVPSVSPFVKRRISESLQQQQPMESGEMTVIKRAKVVLIEQKDSESTPCCSSNDSVVNSALKRTEQSQEKIRKIGNNNIDSRGKGKSVKCDDTNSVNNHYNDNYEGDDSEDVQYVDVESVDEKLNTKEQRKALIEFYRRVKTIRMSYAREDVLICQMCEQKVQNSDSLILIHLYGHAEVMPYRCKMCGASECQLERMYAHIRQGHPNKDPSMTYENRRNMAQLISLLRTCFLRNITKAKAAYSDLIDKICAAAEEKSLVKLTCMICTRKISTRKKSLVRHAQAHLHYRCKDCGIILFDETTIVEHGTKKHGVVDPQRTIHYDACINTSDKREIALKNCFDNILNEKL